MFLVADIINGLSALKDLDKQKNNGLDDKIINIFEGHIKNYGSPRITKDLKAANISCSESRVAKRMAAMGLTASSKKKYKATTDSNHQLPVFDNLLNRDFYVSEPNQKWVRDYLESQWRNHQSRSPVYN